VQIYVPYPGTELFELSMKHGLKVPDKLEDWITFGWINRRVGYPWLTQRMKKMTRMLSFCGVFMPSDKGIREFSVEVSPIISLIAKLYYPVVRFRVRGLHYGFLPEIKVAELLGYTGL
jgi:hypothetical protein